MPDINALQEQIRNITNDNKIRSIEEETADRETLKKLCWDIMVESRGAMSLGREADEAVFRQARMRLTALEHGAAIKDLPLLDELYSFSEAHKDAVFYNAFEAFLKKTDPDNAARSEALEHMLDCCGDIAGDESERIRGLLEAAMNREPGPEELPGQHDYIEKEKYKADTRQTNIAKWTILRDWVSTNEAIPEDMRQQMVNVLSSSIKSGQAPSEKADRDLIDRALTGSYSGDRQKFTGYYSWARDNNGKELPSATYIRKPMEKGRRYLLGGPGDSAVYQRAGGDIFIENNDGVIPREIMNTSNVEEISDFLTVYADELKQINPLYVEYLKRQTESVIKIEGMAKALKNGDKPVPVPVTKKGRGSVIPIKQEEHQTSGNGCWSVAYSNLLQSQGIKLSQQEIRAYRQMKDPVAAGKLTEAEAEILFNDKVANPFEKRDILHTLLPGKAMQEVVFSYTEEGDRKTQLKRTEDFLKKHIKEALDVNHSPVALLVGGHYQTIVGYNGDTLLYKDSLPHEGTFYSPDTTYDDISFRSLAERAINGAETVVLDSLLDVEKLPDVKADVADEASNPGSYAFMNIASGVPGISIKMSHSKQVHSNLMKNVQPAEEPVQQQQQPAQQQQQPVQQQPAQQQQPEQAVEENAPKAAADGRTQQEEKQKEPAQQKGSMDSPDQDVRCKIDLETTIFNVATAKQQFDRLGSKWFTKDTAHYRWMKSSVDNLYDELMKIKMQNSGAAEAELSKSDAIKLEAIFRQVRATGANYVNTHPNPLTPGGRARLKLAGSVAGIGVVYTEKEVRKMPAGAAEKTGVKKVGIETLVKEEASAKKTSSKKTAASKKSAEAKKNSQVQKKTSKNRSAKTGARYR